MSISKNKHFDVNVDCFRLFPPNFLVIDFFILSGSMEIIFQRQDVTVYTL